MPRISKKKKKNNSLIEAAKKYSLKDAIAVLKTAEKAKFDESIDVSMKLNVNSKDMTQPIRGTVTLPHGTGKKVRVCCICKGEDELKARDAGAETVGSDELVTKISGGWCDFDVCVATPEMMKSLSKLGKVLGPKGLMPNPKSGTVTQDVAKTIKEIRMGKIEYKMDKQSGIHAAVGKLSFEDKNLVENATEFIHTVISANAVLSKPNMISSIAIAKSMGPGIKIDVSEFKV